MNMSKTFWAVIAIIVVIFGGILIFKGDKAAAPSSNGAQPTNHIEGAGATGVTLVEYGDYQCIFCGQYYPFVKQAIEHYGDKITFQFRNLPLIEVHHNAYAAARTAEAASLQGKFWEMYNTLYQNQSVWSDSNNAQSYFEQYATNLGLNLDQFKKDASSNKVNDVINADVNAFNQLKLVKSTPTFILDGKKITPGYSLDDFTKLIDAEIAQKAKH